MKRKTVLLTVGALVLVALGLLLAPLASVSVEVEVPVGADAAYARSIEDAISSLLTIGLPLLAAGCLVWVAFHLWRKSRRPPP